MAIVSKSAPRSSQGKQEFWQDHLNAQQRSGLSIGGYCRKQGLTQSAFGYWQRKLASTPTSDRPGLSPVTIVPVPLASFGQAESAPASQPSFPLILTVAGRFRIEVGGDFRVPVLEKLITTLEQLV